MDVYARSTDETTEIYTVQNDMSAIAVLGAALGMVAALITVAAMWLMGVEGNAPIIGAIAGGVAGATTAILGAPGHIE